MKLIIQRIAWHKKMFFTAMFFLLIETFADLMQPAFMARVVDEGVKNKDVGRILLYGAVMLGIAAAGAVARCCATFLPAAPRRS
jgi:ATP-binding cassette subfamily B protein